MNRKKLIQAIERIATADGYTFYSTDEREMPRAIRKYPLIWLSPPLFTSMEGRKQGKITYSLTLHAMQANVKLPSAERERVWEQLEDVIMKIFAALSGEDFVIVVKDLNMNSASYSLTPHGEIRVALRRENGRVIVETHLPPELRT